MLTTEALTDELKSAFEEHQAAAIARVMVKAVREGQRELVKAGDFNELKEIVRRIGIKMEELAEAQKRTEQRVEELAEAQRDTQKEVGRLDRALAELAAAMKSLAKTAEETKTQLGGLSLSMGYALENEAYRFLPGYLKEHGIQVTEKFIRTEIEGEEVNLFARGTKNGREVLIVGESELRLSSVGKKIKQLERKAVSLQKKFPAKEIIKVLVTYYAKPVVMEKAKEKGIIVVQSFEWI